MERSQNIILFCKSVFVFCFRLNMTKEGRFRWRWISAFWKCWISFEFIKSIFEAVNKIRSVKVSTWDTGQNLQVMETRNSNLRNKHEASLWSRKTLLIFSDKIKLYKLLKTLQNIKHHTSTLFFSFWTVSSLPRHQR